MSVPTWFAMFMTLGVAAISQVGGPFAGAFLSDADEQRAINVELLRVSLGVLSNEAHQTNTAIRSWAVDTINNVSEVQITGEARDSLIRGSTGLVDYPFYFLKTGKEPWFDPEMVWKQLKPPKEENSQE